MEWSDPWIGIEISAGDSEFAVRLQDQDLSRHGHKFCSERNAGEEVIETADARGQYQYVSVAFGEHALDIADKFDSIQPDVVQSSNKRRHGCRCFRSSGGTVHSCCLLL